MAGEAKAQTLRQRKSGKKSNATENGVGASRDNTETTSSWLACILKWCLLLLVVPPFLNYAAVQQEKKALETSVVTFDIGFGQNLQMTCSGKTSKQPTIIFEAPTGQSGLVWTPLAESLSEKTKVCIYNRAGLVFSDQSPFFNMSDPGEAAVANAMGPPSTSKRMVNDLHRLVTHANPQTTPFVLVGSELGAVNGLIYALTFPSQVAHVFLIDPVTAQHFEDDLGSPSQTVTTGSSENSWSHYWRTAQLPSLKFLHFSALLGLNRIAILAGFLKPPVVKEASEDLRVQQHHLLCNPNHLYNSWLEHVNLNESSGQLEEAIQRMENVPQASRKHVPCTVITGNYYDELLPSGVNRAWSKSASTIVTRLKCQQLVINGHDHHGIMGQQTAVLSDLIAHVLK